MTYSEHEHEFTLAKNPRQNCSVGTIFCTVVIRHFILLQPNNNSFEHHLNSTSYLLLQIENVSIGLSIVMDQHTGISEEDLVNEVELRQLLTELQQLTKQKTSYTTVLQSLNDRESAIIDTLLQTAAAVESRQMWNKLKDMTMLEQENESLRKKVDELTKAEQLFDARMIDLKSKLDESTSNSKKLMQSKQQLLKDTNSMKVKLDSSRLEQELQRTELDRLRIRVEEIKSDKRYLQQRVDELTTDLETISFLKKEAAELAEKVASMERLQVLRNLRELENTSVNEDTEKMRLELIEEAAHTDEENKHSGWQSLSILYSSLH